ncbi:retrovirus-related Pol polyprotein from transposon 297 [Trichonephila clavipes]|nr:retrovirus-related Pol polyprotein from transposon 297 [Trichonephila clavipes]
MIACVVAVGQTIETYVTQLKTLASTCEFSEQENGLIRDRIVLKIKDSRLQEQLLRENSLNVPKYEVRYSHNKLREGESEQLESKANFSEVLQKFEEYCSPRQNVVYEHYKFFSHVQLEGQTFETYVTQLKTLASTCEFAEQENGLIRHRIVLGIKDSSISKNELIKQYKDVFTGVGEFPNEPYHITLKDNAVPVIHSPRRVPLALQPKLKSTLDRLEKEGIVSKVNKPTDWVQSLVIVEKPNGNLRLCLDPRDHNKVIKREQYQIPCTDDIISRLEGKKIFSVVDLKDGCDEDSHDAIMSRVLERAKLLNIKFNPDKLQYRVSEVKYVGQIISKSGIKPDPDYIKAIVEMPTPKSKTNEKNYAQIEKELLAIVFSFEKYHDFVYGRKVVVQSDHKPLIAIVKKSMHKISSRMQRMILKLLKYDFEINYVPGSQMFLADTLSRAFPVSETIRDDPEMLNIVHTIAKHLPMSKKRRVQFKKETELDPELQIVVKYIKEG